MTQILHKKKQDIYPRQVDAKQFKIQKRLMARIDRAKIDDNLFLGYCKDHKAYFMDHNHTNGKIRCPTCDKKWLSRHNR